MILAPDLFIDLGQLAQAFLLIWATWPFGPVRLSILSFDPLLLGPYRVRLTQAFLFTWAISVDLDLLDLPASKAMARAFLMIWPSIKR